MFCSNCGNQVDDKAVICVKCGSKLTPVGKTKSSEGSSDFVLYLPLIFGIASLLLCWTGVIGTACAVVSIVMAVILKRNEGKEQASKHFFAAGVICSVIGLVIQLIIVFISLMLFLLPGLFIFEEAISMCLVL